MVNIIIPILKIRNQRLAVTKWLAQGHTTGKPGLSLGWPDSAAQPPQLCHVPEWGQSCRRSDYMWGSGSRLLWGLCFPSFQHRLGQVERCTYAQGRLGFNIALCWLLGRCLFKGSGNRCVGPDSITWWRGTHWSMAIFKERCWLC